MCPMVTAATGFPLRPRGNCGYARVGGRAKCGDIVTSLPESPWAVCFPALLQTSWQDQVKRPTSDVTSVPVAWYRGSATCIVGSHAPRPAYFRGQRPDRTNV